MEKKRRGAVASHCFALRQLSSRTYRTGRRRCDAFERIPLANETKRNNRRQLLVRMCKYMMTMMMMMIMMGVRTCVRTFVIVYSLEEVDLSFWRARLFPSGRQRPEVLGDRAAEIVRLLFHMVMLRCRRGGLLLSDGVRLLQRCR